MNITAMNSYEVSTASMLSNMGKQEYREYFIVDAETGQVIELPDITIIYAQLDAESQPAAYRSDSIFKAVNGGKMQPICVDYHWTARVGEKVMSGTYEYDTVSGNIVSIISKISESTG